MTRDFSFFLEVSEHLQVLLLEGLESLALLCQLLNRQLQFYLGGLGDVL